MKKIIYTRPDGGLSVIHPIRNTRPIPEALTDDEILERAMKDIPLDAMNVQIVEEGSIPTDRTFRDAWKAGAGTVVHDMEKCRYILKERLRIERAPLLAALDVQYMRADEVGDLKAKAQIAARKQALRDVTDDPAIESATTPEALKAVMPAAMQTEEA